MFLSYTEDSIQVVFRYAPFHEMMGSLHVLSKPTHHISRLAWAQKMNATLSPEALIDLSTIGCVSDDFIGFLRIIEKEALWNLSISEVLAHMKTMPLDVFLIEVINGRLEPEEIRKALKLKSVALKCPPQYQTILLEKELFREKCIHFFGDYYYNHYATDLSFAEPLLITQLKKAFDDCQKIGLFKYIDALHPRIEVTPQKIYFHKYKVFEAQRDEMKIVLIDVDSYFNPHLLMGIGDGDGFLYLIKPCHITIYDENHLPTDTLQLYKGLADETRLKIIKHLYKEPQSTQHLASELKLTEACISKHLKVLSHAGIASKSRNGNYILYQLNQQVLDSLVLYLYEFIQ